MKPAETIERVRGPVPGRRQRQRGAALIEALIGILIFAVGVLGLVGLQVSMTRAQSAAKYRTDAAFLANELVGQIWADRLNANNYVTTPGSPCDYQRCADWVNKVATTLPSGAASTASTTATGVVSITITWALPESSHTYATTALVR